MQKGKFSVWAAVAIIVAGTFFLACAGPASPETAETVAEAGASTGGEGEILLQGRCTKCHDLARVERASKTRDEWQQTVERMVGKGADLSADEQALVVEYLAKTYGP